MVCAFVEAAVTCCMLLLDDLDHLQVVLDGDGYSCHELAIHIYIPESCALVVFVLYQIHLLMCSHAKCNMCCVCLALCVHLLLQMPFHVEHLKQCSIALTM